MSVDPNIQRQIDENLKRLYQQSVEETVPDQFASLLARLKAQDGK